MSVLNFGSVTRDWVLALQLHLKLVSVLVWGELTTVGLGVSESNI